MTSIQRPPGPGSDPRALYRLLYDPLPFLLDSKERYGDLVYMRALGYHLYQVTHPDDAALVLRKLHTRVQKDRTTLSLRRVLGDGLVTAGGEHWKRHRRLVSFAFTPKRINTYADAMVGQTRRVIEEWKFDDIRDLHHEMSRITLAIVGKTLFGADVLSTAQDVGAAMEDAMEFFANSPEAVLGIPTWVPTPRNLRLHRSIRRLDGILATIIDERQRSGIDREDVLSTLLHARDEDGSTMNRRQIRDECITLFAAGHETTALALTYAFYLLSKYPEVDAILRDEITRVVGERTPTHQDVPKLTYTTAVIRETMRLYPPVWAVGREVTEPFELQGYTLPLGSQINIAQWVIHRDPRWFPNPEAFTPNRFLEGNDKALPKCAYLPFGDGPRVCIGNHFALMEAVLLMATITQQFRLELVPGEGVTFQPSVTLRPGGPIRVRVQPANGPLVRPSATLPRREPTRSPAP